MKVFFDTNVIVAASERTHPHYSRASPALERLTIGKDEGYISVHSIAETYAVLTRLPVQPRIHPAEALRIITENLLPHFETVPIGKKDYVEAIKLVGNGGWAGGKIYDALLVGCASRCEADRIYTFNLSDFRLLAPNLEDKICAPS